MHDSRATHVVLQCEEKSTLSIYCIDALIKSNNITLERPYDDMQMQSRFHKQPNTCVNKSTYSPGKDLGPNKRISKIKF